jgi:hypothetical protein
MVLIYGKNKFSHISSLHCLPTTKNVCRLHMNVLGSAVGNWSSNGFDEGDCDP